MYSIHRHGRMIADTGRINAFAEALRAVVQPDSAVLDLGTGTGILALLACRFGARKVYAIESHDVIELAREAAAANGFADRIEFIHDYSTRVNLPQRVHAIAFDVHGVLPPLKHNLLSIMDARERFLAPGGHLIPRQVTLWAALVHAPDEYQALVGPWERNGYGFDFDAVQSKAVNNWSNVRFVRDQLMTEPRRWATLDYRILSSPNVCGGAYWDIDREMTIHGLAVWFDCELFDGIVFSNSPASPMKHIYAQGFFPWIRPVQLSPGDQVSVQLRADLADEAYVWGWNTEVRPGNDPSRSPVSFRQSTFQGAALVWDQIRKRAQTFVPTLNEEGRIDCMVLHQIAEQLPLDQIARNIAATFSNRFSDWQEALNHVGDLSVKYSL